MTLFRTAVLASLLMAGTAFAQTPAAPKAKSTTAAKAAPAPAVHATKGVVKSVDATTLVITKSAGKGAETSFMLNSATQRQGAIATGAMVDVRYHVEGKDKVATAVSVEAKAAPKAKAAK